tara:strand:- start:439 stop:1560 length:1122 start_codon:yes stop_codon:yes gene_type:complete
MTVRITKPEFNLRGKLSELDNPVGLKGNEILRSETTQDARTLVSAGRKNIIINGDMRIAQRATTSTSDGKKTVDRFGIGFATGAIQQDQITLTSSDTPYAYGFRKSYRLTNTTASTASSAARDIRYSIEAQDILNSGWDSTSPYSKVTLSFWIKASVSQRYYVFHYVPDSSKNYNWNFFLQANKWTKITHTIPGADGLTFNNDNGPGMSIQIVAYYGNDFTASTDPAQNVWFAWSGTNRIRNMSSKWGGTTNATFEVTGVQLEVGSNATEFEFLNYGEQLALCQRYYYKLPVSSASNAGPPAYVYHSGYKMMVVWFPTTMRATPTCTFTSSTDNSGWNQLNNSESHFKAYKSSAHTAATSYYLLTFEANAEFP